MFSETETVRKAPAKVLLLCIVLHQVHFTFRAHGQENAGAETDVPRFLPKKLVALFEPDVYELSDGNGYGRLCYRLFVPRGVEKQDAAGSDDDGDDVQRFPLIFFFHGHGRDEIEYVNQGQIKYLDELIFRDLDSPEDYPFFVLAVQAPMYAKGKWISWIEARTKVDGPSGIEPAEGAVQILDQICAKYPVDMDRISICGISSGANASLELALRYPNRFAAVVALASGGTDRTNLQAIRNLPIWAFHSSGDRPEAIRKTTSELTSLGGGVSRLTEIPGNEHGCWFAAFQEYPLLDWMLAQKRMTGAGSHTDQVNMYARWQFFKVDYLRWDFLWPRLVVPIVVGIVLWSCRAELKRRRGQKMLGEESLGNESGNASGSCRCGFTLIELLVVIAIIGALVALLLPAVEMARESSRRSACANNLRQLAVAARLHVDTHQTFPTGGWGQDWIGDPDAGYRTKQPGGWIYNILSYIEEDNLRQLGRGLKDAPREEALTTLMQMPLEVLHCPSRRLPRTYPYTGGELKNAKPPEKVAKTDYAISSTVSFEKSEVIPSDIQLHGKGMSKTVLVGEKSLSEASYSTGDGVGDTLVAYVGDSDDIRRPPSGFPMSDKESGTGFGGPHPSGANIAYCDGSVHFVNDDVEIEAAQ